jgi:hypothetical protein
MSRKLLMTATAIALIASTGSGISAAGGGGIQGSFVHGGVIHDSGVHHKVMRNHSVSRRGFPATGLGYDDLTGYGDSDAAAEAPSIADVPQPAPAVLAVDRPPCHETTEGVVVMRGSSCSRDAH